MTVLLHDAVGSRLLLWNRLCDAGMARAQRRLDQLASEGSSSLNLHDDAFHWQSHLDQWQRLGDSPVATALFAFDLSDSEAFLASRLSDPFFVSSWLGDLDSVFENDPSDSIDPDLSKAQTRHLSRAGSLAKRLGSLLLFPNEAGARALFLPACPDEAAPFEPFSMARGLLLGRRLTLGALGGSAALTLAGPATHALGLPAFSSLAIMGSLGLAMISVIAPLHLTPDHLQASRILRAAYPSLSFKASRDLLSSLPASSLSPSVLDWSRPVFSGRSPSWLSASGSHLYRLHNHELLDSDHPWVEPSRALLLPFQERMAFNSIASPGSASSRSGSRL